MRVGMIRTLCLSPQHLDGKWATIKLDWPHAHANPAPQAPATAGHMHSHRPWGRAAQAQRATQVGTGDTCMCAWKRWAWLPPCGLCCAGTLGLLHSQPARRWLAPRLGCWPHRGRPAHFDPIRRLCARGSAPAHALRALRPVADVRMPVHDTISRGRWHLRVALKPHQSLMKLENQFHSSGNGPADTLPLAAATGSQVPQVLRSSGCSSACSSLELPRPRRGPGRFSQQAAPGRDSSAGSCLALVRIRSHADDGHGPRAYCRHWYLHVHAAIHRSFPSAVPHAPVRIQGRQCHAKR